MDITMAKEYLYEAWNQTDHADKLVQNARASLDGGDMDSALNWLRQALEPAGQVEWRIRDAINYLENLQKQSER